MIQIIRKKLRVPRIPRTTIAWLAGTSPVVLAFILTSTTRTWIGSHNAGWLKYLNSSQGEMCRRIG